MKGFIEFIRDKGVVGLAVGFILGGAVSGLVKSLVDDIISPILGLALSRVKSLTDLVIQIGDASIKIGDFINVLINFIVIALVVYFGVKWLKLDKLDKPKQ
ncbi:MAG TPA: MscL family protein [Candidatus Paceibacterota bacterium]